MATGETIGAMDKTLLDDPSRIFSVDEMGFPLCAQSGTVIAPKHGKLLHKITNDSHEQITFFVCSAADGKLLDPFIIFPEERSCHDPVEEFSSNHVASSENGLMDEEIFVKWFLDVFVPSVDHLPKPVLLLVDGHWTALTVKMSDLCRRQGVMMQAFIPQASIIQQPLDQMPMHLLELSWRKQVEAFQEKNHKAVGKSEFCKVFTQAWMEGITPVALRNAFRVTGLYPWSAEAVSYTDCRLLGLFTPAFPLANILSQAKNTPAPVHESSRTSTSHSTSVTPLSDQFSSLSVESFIPISQSSPPAAESLSSTAVSENKNINGIDPSSSTIPTSTVSLSQEELKKEYQMRLINVSSSLGREKVDRFRRCIEEGRTDLDLEFNTFKFYWTKVNKALLLPPGLCKQCSQVVPQTINSVSGEEVKSKEPEGKRKMSIEENQERKMRWDVKRRKQRENVDRKIEWDRLKEEKMKKKQERERKKMEREERTRQRNEKKMKTQRREGDEDGRKEIKEVAA